MGTAPMAQNLLKAAGLSVGVTAYKDPRLTRCPAAAASARDVTEALDPKLVRGVRLLVDPATNDTLFDALQKAAREAKGGAFFFYFAGHAMRRGEELLLAVGDSELEGARGCVPLSDVLDILRRTPIERGIVILNIDLPHEPKAMIPRFDDGILILGSSRVHEPASANARFDEYACALRQALRLPALEIEAYLDDGKLDGAGLARAVAAMAPKSVKPEVFATATATFVLRELGAALVVEKTAAEEKEVALKAAAEKAAAERAARENAAAEKVATKKAARDKAAAEKAARDKAAAENPTKEMLVAVKAAPDEAMAKEAVADDAPASGPRAIERSPAAQVTAESMTKEPASSKAIYLFIAALLLATIAWYLLTR